MSLDLATIGIAMDTSGLDKGTRSLKEAEKAADRTADAADRTGNSLRGMSSYADLASKALASIGLGAAVTQFMRVADSVTQLNNALKLSTGSAKQAEQAYGALYEIAQRSRVSFIELGQTFTSLNRAGQEMGVSQQRMLAVTEAVGNAMAISGGSAQSMQAALVQLGQGMSSGVLRGEELNSVMEQAPRLAKALADGLGVPIGKLREMGQAGEITSQQIVKALEAQSSVLSKEVTGATITLSQAFTQLTNSGTKAVGEFDKASGASTSLAQAVSSIASAMDGLGTAFQNNETIIKTVMGSLAGAAALTTLAAVPRAIGAIGVAVTGLSAVLAANPIVLTLLGVGAVVGGGIAAVNAYSKTADGIKSAVRSLEEANERSEAAMQRATAGGRVAGADNIRKTIEERRKAIRELNAELALMSNVGLDNRAEDARLAAGTEQMRAQQRAAEELSGIKQKLNGVDKDYLPTLNKLFAQYQAGAITLKEYQDLVSKLAQNNYKPEKQTAGLKQEQSAYESLISSIRAKIEADKLEIAGGAALTESQRIRIKLDQDLAAGRVKLSAQNERAVRLALEELSASEASALAAKTIAKANLDAAASREKYLTSLSAGLDKIQADITAQIEATERMGLSKEAIADLDAAKLEMMATDLELQAIKAMDRNLDQQTYDALKEQAKLYRELGIAKKAGAAKEAALEMEKANAEAAKKAQDEWQKATDQINQSLTDALMRGFESGKDFAKNMRDTVVNMFKTMVLRPVISAVLSPISGGIQGMMGGVAGGAAGGSNPIGMASNAYSLYNTGSQAWTLGSQYLSGSMSGANALGSVYANATGGGLDALLATNGAYGTAGGGAAAGGGMALGALGYAALIGAFAALASTPASPHTGGASTAGAAVKPGDVQAYFDSIDAKTQTNLDKLTGSSTALLNWASKISGGQGGYSVSANYAADGRDAASGNLVITKLGQILSDWEASRKAGQVSARDFAMGDYGSLLTAQTDSGEAASMADAGPKIEAMIEDQWAQYLEAVKGDLMAQMQASGADLPAWARKMLVPLANVSAEDFATELDKITKQIIALPETIAQQIGYNRDTVVSAWVDGLRTGDATAAGIKAADTFVSGIETQMLTSAAGKIQDIVFSGAIVPIVDSLMQGATLSQALAEANLDEVIKKAQAQAQAFAAVWGNADFQAALAGIHDGYAKVMGDLGTTLNYTPVYTQSTQAAAAAQSDLAAAQSEATRAAEQEAQRLADLHKSLNGDLASLDIELLRRSGQSAAADAAARAKATEGYDAEALALYDLIAVRRAHIADLDAEAARAQQLDGLYAGIYAKIATPAERMAYGYERIAASLQNAGLYAGQSDLASILAEASMPQVRDTVQKLWGESSSQTRLALLDAVGALSDLKTEAASLADQAQQTALNLATQNANAALAIVQRAIDAEKKAGQERLRLAQTEETRLKSLVDYLHGQTLDLYGQSDSTAQWMAAQGQAYIDAALAGGALDRDKLGEAVSAIRATLKPDLFGSAKDMEFQTLVLAGKLGTLEQSTGRQLTAAQRSLKAEEDAAKALDDLAQTQRDALDIARGQYTGILGVQDAIKQLSAAILAEKAISGIMQGSIAGSTYAPKTDTLHSAVTGLDYSGASIGGYLKALNAAGDNAGALDAYQQLTANGATSAMVSKLTGWSLDQINTWVDANNLPRFAGGGWHDGGWAMVGEQGPELAYMPPARIYNAGDTAAMVRGDGGYAELVTEVRALRAEVIALRRQVDTTNDNTARAADAVRTPRQVVVVADLSAAQ